MNMLFCFRTTLPQFCRSLAPMIMVGLLSGVIMCIATAAGSVSETAVVWGSAVVWGDVITTADTAGV